MPPEDQGAMAIQLATLIESVANMRHSLDDVKATVQGQSDIPVKIERLTVGVENFNKQITKLFEMNDATRLTVQSLGQDLAVIKARHKWIAGIATAVAVSSSSVMAWSINQIAIYNKDIGTWQRAQEKISSQLDQRTAILELRVGAPQRAFTPQPAGEDK